MGVSAGLSGPSGQPQTERLDERPGTLPASRLAPLVRELGSFVTLLEQNPPPIARLEGFLGGRVTELFGEISPKNGTLTVEHKEQLVNAYLTARQLVIRETALASVLGGQVPPEDKSLQTALASLSPSQEQRLVRSYADLLNKEMSQMASLPEPLQKFGQGGVNTALVYLEQTVNQHLSELPSFKKVPESGGENPYQLLAKKFGLIVNPSAAQALERAGEGGDPVELPSKLLVAARVGAMPTVSGGSLRVPVYQPVNPSDSIPPTIAHGVASFNPTSLRYPGDMGWQDAVAHVLAAKTLLSEKYPDLATGGNKVQLPGEGLATEYAALEGGKSVPDGEVLGFLSSVTVVARNQRLGLYRAMVGDDGTVAQEHAESFFRRLGVSEQDIAAMREAPELNSFDELRVRAFVRAGVSSDGLARFGTSVGEAAAAFTTYLEKVPDAIEPAAE